MTSRLLNRPKSNLSQTGPPSPLLPGTCSLTFEQLLCQHRKWPFLLLWHEWSVSALAQEWYFRDTLTFMIHEQASPWTPPTPPTPPPPLHLSPGLRRELHRHSLRDVRQLLQSAASVSDSASSFDFHLPLTQRPGWHAVQPLRVASRLIALHASGTTVLFRTGGADALHVRAPRFNQGSQLSCLLIFPSTASWPFFVFLTHREPEYYDYGHGESAETYESYGKEKGTPWWW